MKLYIAKHEPGRIGGGWSFADNLSSGLSDMLTSYEEADTYFIFSPSTVQRSEVVQAKADGKKIVLRLDNVIRNSRNRNTGMTRMKDFCELADLVIYQSEWAKKFLMPYTKTDGVVILNGVDTAKYSSSTFVERPDDSYLYVRSSRDEGKQWITTMLLAAGLFPVSVFSIAFVLNTVAIFYTVSGGTVSSRVCSLLHVHGS